MGAAAGAVQHGHCVSHLDIPDVFAHGLHNARTLVAHDQPGQLILQIGVVAAAHQVVWLAHADDLIAHQNFVVTGRRLGHIGVDELFRPSEFVDDNCFHSGLLKMLFWNDHTISLIGFTSASSGMRT